MNRPVEFLVEVTVLVDRKEIETDKKRTEKERQIRQAIESLDPSIGVFQVESVQ